MIPIVMVSAQDEPVENDDTPHAITIARAMPWQSADMVRWIQNLVDTAVASPVKTNLTRPPTP
jgi:hypothetical protein